MFAHSERTSLFQKAPNMKSLDSNKASAWWLVRVWFFVIIILEYFSRFLLKPSYVRAMSFSSHMQLRFQSLSFIPKAFFLLLPCILKDLRRLKTCAVNSSCFPLIIQSSVQR